MAYQKTSAANLTELLAALVTFATNNGWNIIYNERATVGTQIGLSSGNCHIAIGEETSTKNPITRTDPYDSRTHLDTEIAIVIATALIPTNKRYWGHTGSFVTAAANTNRAIINDCANAMQEVHFYGDKDYIHVTVLSSVDRYTSFGFGHLVGTSNTLPRCAYLFSSSHPWWNGVVGISGTTGVARKTQTNFNITTNGCFPLGATNQANICRSFQVYVPNGVIPGSYDLTHSGTVVYNEFLRPFFYNYGNGLNDGFDVSSSNGTVAYDTAVMSHAYYCSNQATTGGVALFSFPVYAKSTVGDTISVFLGEIPNIVYCSVKDLALGADIVYGGDTWTPYPVKRRGTIEAGYVNQSSYINQPNTYNFGLAHKKVI